ncbi:glutamine--fructose-6-phosphate transaminase (isomerizing) [Candidatus Kaiserbacteria bacterium CG_4_8_14_3_um_filter_38_9]|uniref:Glutamine--fructose-6-phosphate aminotransferase [isomerizing] n=1 Tax=Candidatus Kaiserbacteria bacterium CG_4_8_14_3_um_filter_38_9 TaxID=1974599 RepID=A0A2M7INH2_9BACT|nr:MAG: glutamine--fructose-6-phosphate transaminase (isomerizing) [Candidatus Kaiserbacteria bacterium CG_4_8_14_3_um_filter_38_9]
MCGIFAYTGIKNAEPILLNGLRTLEYRGYDSAGIYIAGLGVKKAVGKVSELAKLTEQMQLGTAGIAHTRWATHGEPTLINAHPHCDMSERIWLVHNGIIENWREIREGLIIQGITFTSQTDTEVLAKLIGSFYSGNLKNAVATALSVVRGTYGIAVMSERNDKEIVVARMGSPIVLGVGQEENFISSDPSALIPYTKKVIYLDDGEIAVVTGAGFSVTNIQGVTKNKKTETVSWDVSAIQKNGFKHFMLKEIFEAPEVIENTIRGRIIDDSSVRLGGIDDVLTAIKTLHRLVIVGCGSAYYAGQVGRLMFEEYAGLPVEVELGSEYRYRRNLNNKHSALLVVTQSGETADTLASVRLAKNLGLLTLGIVNSVGSTIARETDAGVHNHAGPEIAVASTKAFISQLVVMVLLAVLIGREKGMNKNEATEILTGMTKLPDILSQVLKQADGIRQIAEKYAKSTNMIFIGRKMHAPIANEGALKLKEVSYVHAEAYAGGELKHGAIAMLGPDFPVFAIAPQDDVYEKMLSNIEEVRARKTPVILLTTTDARRAEAMANDIIYVPKVHPILQPIVSTIPLQLFAYYVGVARGLNVDQPRNLAKSVTVE